MRQFGLKNARAVPEGGKNAPALSRANTTLRELDGSSSESPFNEAVLVLLLLFGGAVVVLLAVFYAALRAVGL